MNIVNGSKVTIAFAGDISLNGRYCTLNKSFLKTVFTDVQEFLDDKKVDVFIANLESPLEGDGNENLLKNPRLKTSRKALTALKTLSPDIVILGNNHIYDCLEKGYNNTIEWLNKNNIKYVGAVKDEKLAEAYRFSIKGKPFSLLSYVAADTNPSLPEDSPVRLNILDPKRVIADVEKEAEGSFVIISLHWGVEFSHYPSPLQRKMANDFIDSGASLVIGHHSHTVQGREIYNKGHIYYGLGNFAFDDVSGTENPVLWTRDQRHGGLALVTVESGKIKESELYVTHNENLRIKMDRSYSWKKKMQRRTEILKMDIKRYQRFWQIYQFMECVVKPPFNYFLGERKSFFEQLSKIKPEHYKKIFNYLRTYTGTMRD